MCTIYIIIWRYLALLPDRDRSAANSANEHRGTKMAACRGESRIKIRTETVSPYPRRTVRRDFAQIRIPMGRRASKGPNDFT